MILKLENIFYQYDKKLPYILNGISYEFEKGRLYAITGGSGSGKTTLISIIAALARPSSGRIVYDGTDATEIDEDRYRAKYVSTIFQSYNLLYNYTAIENIAMALHISGYTGDFAARADALLEEVGIPAPKRNYVVQNLSGGEQQRIAIARALAADSGVILADEPTGNLDPKTGDQVLRHLREVAERFGQTILLVTHDMEIAAMADRIIRIHGGEIVEIRDTRETV